jgi:hypothetical protein
MGRSCGKSENATPVIQETTVVTTSLEESIESVTQLDDKHLHWIANIGGVRREWDAVIT